MRHTAYIGRTLWSLYRSALSYNIKSLLILSHMTAPAFICGCRKDLPDPIIARDTYSEVKSCAVDIRHDIPIKNLEIFIFEDDSLQTLDSYQRFENLTDNTPEAASRYGKKIMFACANSQWDRDDWMRVNSFRTLESFKADLSKEERAYPLMTGVCRFEADMTQTVIMEMIPLTSEIILRTFSCDFRGKGWEDTDISDIRIYLTNINSTCSILADGTIMPEGILNQGGVSHNDIGNMTSPDLILHKHPDISSGESSRPDIRLRCYPNTSVEESPGSPFTRLVIEGKIGNERYYWPIDVGRGEPFEYRTDGVSRNHSYIYDVTITGKGSSDPDIPVRNEDVEINVEIKKWRECQEYVICF